MKKHLPEEYNRRPIVETVHSVINEEERIICEVKDSRAIGKGNSVKDNRIQHQEDINAK